MDIANALDGIKEQIISQKNLGKRRVDKIDTLSQRGLLRHIFQDELGKINRSQRPQLDIEEYISFRGVKELARGKLN